MSLVQKHLDAFEYTAAKGVGNDPPSLTGTVTTLKCHGSGEVLSLPVLTCTKVREVKAMLSQRLGVDAALLRFVYKAGCTYRVNSDLEEIARRVVVHGLDSFSRVKKIYDHPHAIIGAGHLGLKLAMTWLMEGFENFVLFERIGQVGGTSWRRQANVTSRLQTEAAVYHLEYHDQNGWPEDAVTNPWPSSGQLLKHFEEVSERFGILPHIRFHTNVTNINIVASDARDFWSQTYELTLEKNGLESKMEMASVAFFPGNLTNPKKVHYQGEDQFDGDIVYGISSSYDYSRCTDRNVAIVGSGAFAVENVRTCVEFHVKKIYMICRRKTLAMPRVVSWLINQSRDFISAGLMLEAMGPMYDLIGVDQWQYYAVSSNGSRTNVHIRQASRFGIGDVYYLAMYYGKCEHLVDDIKRVSRHRVHLKSERTLEDVTSLLKLLGFTGEFENDKLMKLKELFGFWCNKDFRRYIVAEPLGVDANNFGCTSFSPGGISWAEQQVHMLAYPKDWAYIKDNSVMPVHTADPSIDRPAYVVEARHGALVGITLGAIIPMIAERNAVTGPLKRTRMWQIHPPRKFLELAAQEWTKYSEQFQAEGLCDLPPPPYPYTLDLVESYLRKEQEAYDDAERMQRERSGK